MHRVDLNAVADILEKIAHLQDVELAAKEQAQLQERTSALASFKNKFAAETGEELSEDTLAKLAKADPEVQQILQKLGEQGAPDDLGAPSSIKTAGVPLTKSEKTAQSEKSFLAFCVNESL